MLNTPAVRSNDPVVFSRSSIVSLFAFLQFLVPPTLTAQNWQDPHSNFWRAIDKLYDRGIFTYIGPDGHTAIVVPGPGDDVPVMAREAIALSANNHRALCISGHNEPVQNAAARIGSALCKHPDFLAQFDRCIVDSCLGGRTFQADDLGRPTGKILARDLRMPILTTDELISTYVNEPHPTNVRLQYNRAVQIGPREFDSVPTNGMRAGRRYDPVFGPQRRSVIDVRVKVMDPRTMLSNTTYMNPVPHAIDAGYLPPGPYDAEDVFRSMSKGVHLADGPSGSSGHRALVAAAPDVPPMIRPRIAASGVAAGLVGVIYGARYAAGDTWSVGEGALVATTVVVPQAGLAAAVAEPLFFMGAYSYAMAADAINDTPGAAHDAIMDAYPHYKEKAAMDGRMMAEAASYREEIKNEPYTAGTWLGRRLEDAVYWTSYLGAGFTGFH
jgi:hypothetical protein